MEKLLSAEEFGWELEEYMTGKLDSQRLARVRANMPIFYPQPCKSCANGYHEGPGSDTCGCPCHEVRTEELRHAA